MSSSEKIKLVQIIADAYLGGGPKHVLGLLRHVDKSKFDCYLICPAGDLAHEAKNIAGVQVFNVEFNSKFDFLAQNNINKRLAQIQAGDNPFGQMIVHTHGPRAGLIGRRAIPKGACSVYTEHIWSADYHLESRINEWMQKVILARLNRKSDLIIAVSEAVRNFLIQSKLAPSKRVIVIPNAIETEVGSGLRRKLPKKHGNHFVLGNVGNLNHQKGQIYLVEAMLQIVKRYPHATLEIIGEGPERASLEEKIKELGLERHVALLGKLRDPMVHMAKWDILAVSSLSETFAIVVLEAFVVGLPAVATAVGGVPEIVKDGKNGLLVAPMDPSGLAQSIMELMSHPAKAEVLARQGKQTAKKYSWPVIIKEIESAYFSILK